MTPTDIRKLLVTGYQASAQQSARASQAGRQSAAHWFVTPQRLPPGNALTQRIKYYEINHLPYNVDELLKAYEKGELA